MVRSLTSFREVHAIKFLVLDFDGVLTDNIVMLNEKGEEYTSCSRYDGYGIELCKMKGINVCIMSSEASNICQERAKKLKIKCYNNIKNKLSHCVYIANLEGVSLDEICFIGNDINDICLLDMVKFPVCPRDSHQELLIKDYYRTELPGGRGCVRELCDFLVKV